MLNKHTVRKLLRHPLQAIGSAFQKMVVKPLRYGRRGAGYDAERYWGDRLAQHGLSLRGAGDEGLSEEENARAYRAAAQQFLALCRTAGVDFATARVLEVGVGTGFYTGLLQDAGVARYVGLDITDALFPALRERFPAFEFLRGDIAATRPAGAFDLIVMMDVVEHIVEESKLAASMRNLHEALAPGGLAVVSGLQRKRGKHLFYVHAWRAEDIERHFPGWEVTGPQPYRNNHVLLIRRPAQVEHR